MNCHIVICFMLQKAYDNFLKAKKATEIRNRQLESKRKHLKEGTDYYSSVLGLIFAGNGFIRDVI